jgi:diketogulonate reductase-like aldo/keto reductase
MSANWDPPADKAEMIALLRRAIDLGVTFLDIAEVCGPFTNEELGYAGSAIISLSVEGRLPYATCISRRNCDE